MEATVLWLSVVIGGALLFTRGARNPGYFALAGSTLGLLVHYGIATVPEVHDLAMLFWLAAAALLAARTFAGRRRRTA